MFWLNIIFTEKKNEEKNWLKKFFKNVPKKYLGNICFVIKMYLLPLGSSSSSLSLVNGSSTTEVRNELHFLEDFTLDLLSYRGQHAMSDRLPVDRDPTLKMGKGIVWSFIISIGVQNSSSWRTSP